MFDIIFYNKVNRSVIAGYKNTSVVPNVKDHVILNGQEHVVEGVLYDYEKSVIHIFVRKVNLISDVTFL